MNGVAVFIAGFTGHYLAAVVLTFVTVAAQLAPSPHGRLALLPPENTA